MYNPEGDDNNKEFIEVFSDGEINLSDYSIEDSSSGDTLTLLQYCDSDYYLITEEGFNFSGIEASVYSVGATIGNNLNNGWDLIILKDDLGNILDAISYSSSWGADGNDNSLCKIPDKDGMWQECNPTPGRENTNELGPIGYVDYVVDGDTFALTTGERVRLIGIDTPEIEEDYHEEAKNKLKELIDGKQVTLEKDVENKDMYDRLLRYIYVNNTFVNLILVEEGFARAYPYPPNIKYEDEFADAEEKAKNSSLGIWSLSQNYASLKINEFLPNPAGYDDAPMPGGEWVELYNSGNESIDVKGLILNDDFGNGVQITEVNVADNTIIDPHSLLVIYRNGNGRLELNNDGFDQVILSYQGAVIDSVSYSDAAEGNSYAYVEGVGWQHTKPTPNEGNVNYNDVKDSHFKIGSISDLGSDNETEFGDIIKVNFHVYKGDTTKSSIKLYIENDEDRITKLTKASLGSKFTNYSLTLPIPIKSNCNQKYEDGDYYVKIGWTSYSQEEDSFKLKVKGINMDNCDKIYVERKPRKGTLEHNLVESPGAVEANRDFIVTVELTNNDGEDHIVDLYSYVYRGAKSYSGERDANKKRVLVKAGQTKEFELKNIVRGAEPGGYKLKIKAKRDDQKTEKEITQAITVFQEKGEEEIKEKQAKIELKEKDKEDYSTILESTKQPEIIYESSSIKAKKLVVYFFIGLLVMYAGVLTWRR